MVDIQIKKKKKKSKRKTKKKLTPEKIQNIINIYLNNKDIRKRKRRQAQQQRNPLRRLGGAYPIQNKAIDAISYSNQFRHTNDTRIMAIERGLNGLTGNMTQLTAQMRRLEAPPLLQPKPAIEPPSENYLEMNPNFPSSVVGSSLDLDDFSNILEKTIEQKRDFETQQKEIRQIANSFKQDLNAAFEDEVEIEQMDVGLLSNQGDNKAEELILPTLPTRNEIQSLTDTDRDAFKAEKILQYAKAINLHDINKYFNSEGLVKASMIGSLKKAMYKQIQENKKPQKEGGGI